MNFIPRENWNPKLKNLATNLKGGYYSQHNEAEIAKNIFEVCEPRNKWCVEFGAGDGKNLSNTYYFIEKLGWSSVQIEARQDQFDLLKETFKGNKRVHLFHKLVRFPRITYNGRFNVKDDIESILDNCKEKVPFDLDFMNIDIDSHDYEVWRGMERYRPNLICIECNAVEGDLSVLNYDPSWSVNVSGNMWYGGATVGLLNKLAEEKGYYFVCAEKCNAIYIEKKFAEPLLV